MQSVLMPISASFQIVFKLDIFSSLESPSLVFHDLSSFLGVRLASAAADVIAKCVWAVAHPVTTPAVLVSAPSAFATLPSPVELLETTSSG